MELSFVAKEQSGWRGRGAPPLPVPKRVLDILKRADGTGEVGVVDIDGESDSAVHELVVELRRGARHMRRRLRYQHDRQRHELRFELVAPHSEGTP